jgi:cysteine desulfurase
MKFPIFMDNHSTTPMDPRVLEVMLPYFVEKFGNAASRNHAFGWEAEEAVDHARKQIARFIHADPKELVFTSGATESDNLAIKGVVEMYQEKGNHIITSMTEHRAVLDTCKALESKRGVQVTYLPVDKAGMVNPDDVRNAITDKTVLITIMLANNEIGTINPIGEIGKIAKEKGILFHCDATQGVGKISVNVQDSGIDLMSFSAHKIYGPKGVGALYVRKKGPRVRIAPMIDGGGHERGMRSGTLPVPLIVGFGHAIELCEQEMQVESKRISDMRDRLQVGIMNALEESYLNGHPTQRLPNNLNISFAYVEGESLLMGVKEIALSSGSACTSATLEPSYVLRALGVGSDLAHSSIRFGLGRFNTNEEVDYTVKRIIEIVTKLREMSPLVRNGQRRCRLEIGSVGSSLTTDCSLRRVTTWRIAKKSLIILIIHATWGVSRKKRKA